MTNIQLPDEIFKTVEGYSNRYEVSNYGRVITLFRGITKLMHPSFNTKKYLHVTLMKNKKRTCMKVHRLVATAFLPNPNSLPEVNHKNGIKTDNSVTNLEWISSGDNQRHAYRIGLKKPPNLSGENNNSSKLKLVDVISIRLMIANKVKQRSIAKMFGIANGTVNDIKMKRTWKIVNQ